MHAFWLAAVATNLVTGNGFGFAVVSPETATITQFYAQNPLGEGVETANFIQRIRFPCGSAAYEQDSHIIRVHCADRDGLVFMPFGFEQSALIVRWDADLPIAWSHHVRSRTAGQQYEVLRFDAVEESLLVIPIPSGRAFIAVDSASDPADVADAFERWRAGRSAEALAAREIAELEQWRVPAPANISQRELHLWRQSEVVLRMAQSREPNRPGRYGNGLIVASLPDGAWFTPWVRDMSWAAMALTRMGHRDEARAALLAFFNMEGIPNIEFDNWGEVLWLLGAYMQTYHDTTLLAEQTSCGRLYDCARDRVVAPLIANTESYGGGLLLNQDKKHFAFSTGMAIVGLKGFVSVADDTAGIARAIASLQKGFDAAFIRDGTLHGTLEDGVKNDIDGALLTLIHLGVVTDPAVVQSTVERMELLKVATGGYRRVRSTYTDPAIFEYWYERQEFLFVDLSLAAVDRQLGRNAEAAAIVQRIVDKSGADHDIIPEMYVALPCKLFPGKIGDPTGATPMVGYGAGAYILDLLH